MSGSPRGGKFRLRRRICAGRAEDLGRGARLAHPDGTTADAAALATGQIDDQDSMPGRGRVREGGAERQLDIVGMGAESNEDHPPTSIR